MNKFTALQLSWPVEATTLTELAIAVGTTPRSSSSSLSANPGKHVAFYKIKNNKIMNKHFQCK